MPFTVIHATLHRLNNSSQAARFANRGGCGHLPSRRPQGGIFRVERTQHLLLYGGENFGRGSLVCGVLFGGTLALG